MLNFKILSTGKNAVIVEVNCYILYFTASHHVAWPYTFARVKKNNGKVREQKGPKKIRVVSVLDTRSTGQKSAGNSSRYGLKPDGQPFSIVLFNLFCLTAVQTTAVMTTASWLRLHLSMHPARSSTEVICQEYRKSIKCQARTYLLG